MPGEQLIQVDPLQEKELIGILPRSPVQSSHSLSWAGGLHVQNHQQPAWDTPEHRLTHHTIVVHHFKQTAQSERTLDDRKQTEQLSDGSIVLIPAQALHKVVWNQAGEFTLLVLEPEQVAQIAYEAVDADRVELIPSFAMPDPLIYQIGLALESELESKQSANQFYIDSLRTALSAHLLRHYSALKPTLLAQADGLSFQQLQCAIDYINDSLSQDIKLAEIAEIVGMSQYYFCRLFRQSTGIAPYQYVIQQRVERAKLLLKQPNLSIADVALQCGFANQSHLTKVFRQQTGLTPKSYRNQQ